METKAALRLSLAVFLIGSFCTIGYLTSTPGPLPKKKPVVYSSHTYAILAVTKQSDNYVYEAKSVTTNEDTILYSTKGFSVGDTVETTK